MPVLEKYAINKVLSKNVILKCRHPQVPIFKKKELVKMVERENRVAIITTGGTEEPIDDVRCVTNFSTGKFAHDIATELSVLHRTQPSCRVLYEVQEFIPSRSLLSSPADVTQIKFTTAASLRQLLLAPQQQNPDLVIMAAAVADYTPVKPSEGKISSNQSRLVIEMERTPKILAELRDRYGPETFIVGFKLLSGATRQELIRAGREQLEKYRLNLVIANDLRSLKNGNHPVIVLTPEGGIIDIEGARKTVAVQLARFIHQRSFPKRYHSKSLGRELPNNLFRPNMYDQVVRLGQQMNLFPDKSGFVSSKLESTDKSHQSIWVSPRQIDKGKMQPQDAILAGFSGIEVKYYGQGKPSTDTPVCVILYEHLPCLRSLLHFHGLWGRMSATTTFPYPCGALAEVAEIMVAYFEREKQSPNPLFCAQPLELAIELLHHGALLGFEDIDQVKQMRKEWERCYHEFRAHLQDVEDNVGTTELSGEELDPALYRPIFDGFDIVGVIYDDPKGAIVYLSSLSRGRGVGEVVTEQLKARRYTVKTTEYCGVVDYYTKQGFEKVDISSCGVIRLALPE